MSLSPATAVGQAAFRRGHRLGPAVLVALAACAPEPPPPLSPRVAVPARPSVAVVGVTTAGVPGLATVVAESLRAELAGDSGLRIVPAATVVQAVAEVGLAQGAEPTPALAAELQRRLGVAALTWGACRLEGGRVHLRVTLQGPGRQPLREVFAGTGDTGQLLEAVADASTAVLAALGRPRPQPGRRQAELPRSPEAAKLYAAGLERLRAHDPRGAQQLLQRAAVLAADHPRVHAALAEAWEQLGYDRRAGEEAGRAHALSGSLPREERLVLEALWRRRQRDHARAALIYAGLARLFPDQPEHALDGLRAQIAAGQRRQALMAIDALRLAGLDDPRLDLAEAEAAQGLAEYARAEAAAARAEAAGHARGAPGLVARALLQRALALRDLGQLPAALQAMEQARSLFERAADPGGAALALNWRGTIERRFGRLAAARASYEAALAVSDQIGDLRHATLARNQLAVLLRQQGALGAARRRHEEVLTAYRELGDAEGMTIALSSAGWVRRLQGDLAGARTLLGESLSLSREIGHRLSEAIALNTLAWVAFDQGELAAARAGWEQTLELNRALGSERSAAFSLVGLAQVALCSGETRAARSHAEETLRLRERLGEDGGIAEARLLLAEAALEDGGFAEAEAAATLAVAVHRAQGEPDATAWAAAVRALALVGLDREAEGQLAREEAAALAAKSENARVRLRVGVVAAALRAESAGRVAEALSQIDRARREAARRGLRGVELEARLAGARLEHRFGDARAGRAQLVALARAAERAGFLALARRARAGIAAA